MTEPREIYSVDEPPIYLDAPPHYEPPEPAAYFQPIEPNRIEPWEARGGSWGPGGLSGAECGLLAIAACLILPMLFIVALEGLLALIGWLL